jgi:hypothetical protein
VVEMDHHPRGILVVVEVEDLLLCLFPPVLSSRVFSSCILYSRVLFSR